MKKVRQERSLLPSEQANRPSTGAHKWINTSQELVHRCCQYCVLSDTYCRSWLILWRSSLPHKMKRRAIVAQEWPPLPSERCGIFTLALRHRRGGTGLVHLTPCEILRDPGDINRILRPLSNDTSWLSLVLNATTQFHSHPSTHVSFARAFRSWSDGWLGECSRFYVYLYFIIYVLLVCLSVGFLVPIIRQARVP